MKEKVLYTFKTKEFDYHPKEPAWYVNLTLVFLVIAGVFIYFFHYYLTSVIVLLGLIALFVHASHEPKEVTCQITNKHIKVGRKKYPYSKVVSYWIYNQQTYPKLYLKTDDLLFDVVSIPLGAGDPEKIAKSLEGILPRDDRSELISDKVSRWIGY